MMQLCPMAQASQLPPQSTSVSLKSCTPLVQWATHDPSPSHAPPSQASPACTLPKPQASPSHSANWHSLSGCGQSSGTQPGGLPPAPPLELPAPAPPAPVGGGSSLLHPTIAA